MRRFRSGAGYDPPVQVALSDQESKGLLSKLAAIEVGVLPVNLFAESYLDLTLEVLDQRVSIQARRFAGMAPDSLGARQLAFERLLTAVREIPAVARARAQG